MNGTRDTIFSQICFQCSKVLFDCAIIPMATSINDIVNLISYHFEIVSLINSRSYFLTMTFRLNGAWQKWFINTSLFPPIAIRKSVILF